MKVILLICIFFGGNIGNVLVGDTIKFLEVKNKRRQAIELFSKEKIILKKGNEILIFKIERASYRETDKYPVEKLIYNWCLIQPDKVTVKTSMSYLLYIRDRNKNNQFTVKGSQLIKRGVFKFSWSYSSPNNIWLYIPQGYNYLKISPQTERVLSETDSKNKITDFIDF